MFEPELRRLEKLLDVPYPARRDLLAELNNHLEDLFQEMVASGVDEVEARSRSLEAMALDQSFLRSINEVHRPAVVRSLSRLPRPVSLGVEYGVITLAAVALFGCVILQEAPMLKLVVDGGIFMVPINLAGFGILLLVFERLYSLHQAGPQ